MGIISGLLSMFFWGTAIFLAALASRKIGNVLTLYWMQLFGFLTGSIYFIFQFESFDFDGVPQHIPILLVIAFLQVIAYLAFYKGLEKAKVSLVSPIGASWGLIVVMLSVIFLDEVLSTTQLLAIALIVVGIVSMSLNVNDFLKLKKVELFIGVKEGIIAMLGWGFSLFLLITPTKDLEWFLPAYIFRFILLLVLSVYVLLSLGYFIPKNEKFPIKLLVMIGFFDMAGFLSYSYGVAGAHASIVAPIGSAFAVVSVLLALAFLKEKLKFNQIVGICAVLIGLVLMAI